MWHQHDCIILDACCVLTLYASGRMTEILESVPVQTMLSRYVLEEEALYTYSGPDGDERSAKEPVGLTPLRNQGLIEVSSLSGEAEIRSFVDLASRLDDGEALRLVSNPHPRLVLRVNFVGRCCRVMSF